MEIRQTNYPSRHKEALGVFRGSNIQKVWRSCQTAGPIGTNFGSRLRIHLGMDIAKYDSPLNTTGGISFFLGGHQFKSGKAAKRMDRLAPNSYTSVDSCGNGHRLKTIRPTIPHGGILGSFRGSTIQKPGKCGQIAGPIGNKFVHIMQMNLGMDTD